jgi:hypothetical protein
MVVTVGEIQPIKIEEMPIRMVGVEEHMARE